MPVGTGPIDSDTFRMRRVGRNQRQIRAGECDACFELLATIDLLTQADGRMDG